MAASSVVATRRRTASSAEAAEYVRLHGRTSFSFSALSPGLSHFHDGSAWVAYADLGDAWVAVSNPLTSVDDQLPAMERFVAAGRRAGKRVRFFGVEGQAVAHPSLEFLHIGEQPEWDPHRWPGGLRRKLRGQLRRARTREIVVTRRLSQAEVDDPCSPARCGLERVIASWRGSRRMAPMTFLAGVEPFHRTAERRFFVAERGGQVVGALIAIPVYGRQGFFFDNILRAPDAPNGSVELLFDQAVRSLAQEGCRHVTFGLCPLMGCRSPLLRHLRSLARPCYNFEGLQRFKAKLMPDAWRPVYLAYPRGDAAVLALYDGARPFLPGGPARFLCDSLSRRMPALSQRATARALGRPWLEGSDQGVSPGSTLVAGGREL